MRSGFSERLLSVSILIVLAAAGSYAQTPVPQQSTSQVVGTAEPKEAERKEADRAAQEHKSPELPAAQIPGLSTKAKAVSPAPVSGEQAFVVPPPPSVIKKNVSTVSVPADVAKGPQKFEERPVVASSISVGSDFGYRRDPFTRRAKFHSGVDIKAKLGDAVGASCGGIVQYAGWYHGYGNLIIVDHGGGVTTHYAHLSSFDVEVGQRVERGTIVGRAGSTGRATSPHLHYEVRIDGSAVNPLQPLALDASSEFFKQSQPVKPAAQPAQPAAESAKHPQRVN